MLRPVVYAFIDSQNLNLGVRSQGWVLDFRKFRRYLTDKYNVSKAYLFVGHVPGNEQLYTYLVKSGYLLILKPTTNIKFQDKYKIKGNVDAELVLYAMIYYPNYDKAIIVSGDGDFYCLIKYLDENHKLAKILVPSGKYSSLLKQFNRKSLIARVDLLKSMLINKKAGIRVRSKP